MGRRCTPCAASRDVRTARHPAGRRVRRVLRLRLPATRYQLLAGRRIVEVDGKPTPDLDAFIDAIKGRPDRSWRA
jgi:hypothetical protein